MSNVASDDDDEGPSVQESNISGLRRSPQPHCRTSPRSQSTVTTITTSIAESEESELPPIKHIWECNYIEQCIVRDNKAGWICKWCNNTFFPRHATRVLNHVLKITKGDISVCKAAIQKAYTKRYRALYDINTTRLDSRKRSKVIDNDHVSINQDAGVNEILARKSKTRGNIVSYLSSHFFTRTNTFLFFILQV